MKVRIKKLHKDAVVPSYAHKGDAGMDLTAIDYYFDLDGNVVYHTGLAIEIPEGYVGLVFPRSSVCKNDISLANAVGVIDSGYRGEITLKFKPHWSLILMMILNLKKVNSMCIAECLSLMMNGFLLNLVSIRLVKESGS